MEENRKLILLSHAAKEFGVSQNYLRFLIFKKKLRGKKIGQKWCVTREWVNACFQKIDSRKVYNGKDIEPASHSAYNHGKEEIMRVEARLSDVVQNLAKIQES